MNPKVSVVILNYNGRELLRKFLPSVIRFSPSSEIIVADNNSTDSSAQIVAAEFPSVGLIQIPTNLGFCGGYNYALQKVKADYYVLLNSDVEVTEGWLAPVIALLESHPSVGAAQPKILSHSDKASFEYAGAGGGFIDALGYPFCRGRIFDSVEKDSGLYDDVVPVFWATGACMVVRANLYHKLGGLDEDFFAHMEEIDLCWKLHRTGYEVYYVGTGCVFHVGGGTLSKANPRKTYFNFRNGLSLIYKHLPTGQLIWKLPVRILLDWVAAAMFLVKGSGGDTLAVLKAHLHFLGMLPRNYKKRAALGRFPRAGTWRVFERSIVLDYFLLGKKRFRDLRF